MAMIDQMTVGHQFLDRTFGYNPRIGWQVDPFGHSSTQAALMTGALGFDALYFGRADYQVSKPPPARNSLGSPSKANSWACSSIMSMTCLLAFRPVPTVEEGQDSLTVRLHTCCGPDDYAIPGAGTAVLAVSAEEGPFHLGPGMQQNMRDSSKWSMHWLQDMAIRGPKKQFELVWRGAKSYGSSADVLTGNFASGIVPMPGPLPFQVELLQLRELTSRGED